MLIVAHTAVSFKVSFRVAFRLDKRIFLCYNEIKQKTKKELSYEKG